MILSIPLEPGLPHQAFRVDLDGATYVLELRWNSRAEEWFIRLSDGDEKPISSTKVALGVPLFCRSVDPRRPLGKFFALDTAGRGEDAAFEDLGRRVQLVYADAESVAALG